MVNFIKIQVMGKGCMHSTKNRRRGIPFPVLIWFNPAG